MITNMEELQINNHYKTVIHVDKYVKILKENGIRVTPQRLEILGYLDKHRTHPTVDEIYLHLKKRNPSLSKTTIYNSLDVLHRYNIVYVLTISGSEQRYDFNITPHHHFLCRQCGTIIDAELNCAYIDCPFLEKAFKGKHKIEEVHGYFKGICRQCRVKNKTVVKPKGG